MMYIDLDELPDVFSGRWFWSSSRPALARFRRENYLGKADEPLPVAVRNRVEEETGVRPTGPIRLLTHLSYFGYCFNPISVYYCFDEADTRVDAIVAEVTNTPWGERHSYVLSDAMNKGDDTTRNYETRKKLHVSPFMDMEMVYDWLLTEPRDNIVLRINNRQDGQLLFGATLILRRHEISSPALARILLRHPFMTLKIAAAIRWQALKLWLKGCPVCPHPDKQVSLEVQQ
jgi:DUF1365 family protein